MKDDKWRNNLPTSKVISQEKRSVSAIVVDGDQVLVPNMTEDEVLEGIASRGKRMVPVKTPDFCSTIEFREILSCTYISFIRDGMVPNYHDVAAILRHIKKSKVQRVMGHPMFRYAMKIRGVEYNIGRIVSPEQDMAIAIMGTPDGRTFEQKLKAAGVSPAKWKTWLKQPAFQDAWGLYTNNILLDSENDMLVALVGQALTGDVGAIKYAFEVSGKYSPARQQNIDVAMFVNQILEIMQQEIKDTATLSRIAARMQLAGATPGGQSVISGARAAIMAAPVNKED